jgi:RNA polymerase sigma-70 factor (ECF subfamily)
VVNERKIGWLGAPLAKVQQKVLTDMEVVERVLGGDQDAFAAIVERYQKGLANYIFHMVRHYEEAIELTQEVFLKAYANLRSYDRGYKFSTWLYKIASNHTIDHLRRQRAPETPIEVSDEEGFRSYELPLESHVQNPHDCLAMKDLMGHIREAVDDLPPSYRELVILRHFNFRSYEEMAKITGLPLGTVKNRIFRARQMLMERLKDVR